MASTTTTVDDHDPKSPLLPVTDAIERPESFQFSLGSIINLNNVCILAGPLLCAVICLFVKLNGPTSSRNMLAVLVWIFEWWMTEAVPMPITSMAPLFLFPLFGIATADDVAHSYMDDVIALVLGSFILALAVEHYNIHRRLALTVSTTKLNFTYLITNLDSIFLGSSKKGKKKGFVNYLKEISNFFFNQGKS